MKLFKCQACGQLVYFENNVCERCGRALGFLPEAATISALEREGSYWRALAAADSRRLFRFCANAQYDACNWLVPADQNEAYCRACRHNRTVPDLADPANLEPWRKIELAKHRLFYTLLRLHLPLANRVDDPQHGLAFDILADTAQAETGPVVTGHDDGAITLALKEGDDAMREMQRMQMGETYRTTLGHFRHEIGHYYWDRLIRDHNRLDFFRDRFGDERQDYAAALRGHYARGPAPDWQQFFVSAYASTHPWEDFAETWAHYMHIVDTLETAGAFGLTVHPGIDRSGDFHADLDFDPHGAPTIEGLVSAWLPLTFAVNSLNRSMGQPDLYPFVLSPAVIGKLGAVHQIVHDL